MCVISLTFSVAPELILSKTLRNGRTLRALLSIWSIGPLWAVGRGTVEVYENHLSCGQFPKWI